MDNFNWYKPTLKELDISNIIRTISVKASSIEEPDDCYGGNVLKGDVGGGGGVPGIPGEWITYCVEVGPLGGCDNWAACADTGIPILSNEGDAQLA